MTRVDGRAPGPQAATAGDGPAAPDRSWVEPAAAAVGLAGVLALLWSSPPARRLPVWSLALVCAVLIGSYLAWRFAAPRLGRVTAGAAVAVAGFLVAGGLSLVPPSCPVADGEARCTGQQAVVAGLSGMLSVVTAVVLTAGAVAVATAVLRGGRLAGLGAKAAGRSLGRAERSRRERRDAGVRWLPGSARDPAVVAGAVAAVVAGAVAWAVYRDAGSALAWATGGALAGWGLPTAWAAGGRARELRAARDRRKRRGRRRR